MKSPRMGRMTGLPCLALLMALSPTAVVAEIGISTRFGDVILEGLKPGSSYALKELAHLPYGVKNHGDADMDVTVEFAKPRKEALAKNYEGIPNLTWIKAVPDRMRIPPKGIGYFDLLLSLPDDPKLVGRNFQVQVDAIGTGMGLYGVAAESRVRFSVGPGPDTLQAEKKKNLMRQLDFDVTPHTVYLTEVPVGKSWDSSKARKTVRVANYAKDPLDVVLSLEPWGSGISMPTGYSPIPNMDWIKVKTTTVSVASDEIGQTGFVLDIPDEPRNRGQHWAVLVRTGLVGGFWLDAPVKILVETNP